MVYTKEMVFQQKLLEKAYFNVEMTLRPWSGRPRSSDFWKVPKVRYQMTTDQKWSVQKTTTYGVVY